MRFEYNPIAPIRGAIGFGGTMRHSHTFAIMLSMILMSGEVKSAEEGKAVPARKQEKQKVLFLTNSTFHAHGGAI